MPDFDLDTLTLAKGGHQTRDQGVCLMEAAAWLAGQPHTDHPPCVSPVLGMFGRNLNDVLLDDTRQLLKPYIRPMLGTAGDGNDEARSYLALDWLIRTYLPAWLDLAGLAEAGAVRGLASVTDLEAARAAGPVVRAAAVKAAAAGAAAWDAARDAAWAAARDAAWDAARDAARDAAGAAAWAAAGDAAWAAAGDAAWAAAGAAAWDAARDAAWAAARDAAWDAARAAAGDAAWAAAGDAAWAAARDELAPTVAALQADAIRLFGVMIDGV
jgi:hypothetical protein